ncbi:MAG: glycosyl transferase family 1, partial [Acidobacteria bacterium]
VLVQKASAEALARVAGRMLGDKELKERLSRAARETVTSRYSADRMIDDTAHIFEELISDRTAGR